MYFDFYDNSKSLLEVNAQPCKKYSAFLRLMFFIGPMPGCIQPGTPVCFTSSLQVCFDSATTTYIVYYSFQIVMIRVRQLRSQTSTIFI